MSSKTITRWFILEFGFYFFYFFFVIFIFIVVVAVVVVLLVQKYCSIWIPIHLLIESKISHRLCCMCVYALKHWWRRCFEQGLGSNWNICVCSIESMHFTVWHPIKSNTVQYFAHRRWTKERKNEMQCIELVLTNYRTTCVHRLCNWFNERVPFPSNIV